MTYNSIPETENAQGQKISQETITAWRNSAGQLADFAMKHMVNRWDTNGCYCGGKIGRDPTPTNRNKLILHFAGATNLTRLGLYTTNNLEQTCKWFEVEVDAHTDAARPENWLFISSVASEAVKLGFRPLVEDSNGKVFQIKNHLC